MAICIKVSDYDPSIHEIVSGPYTLEECLSGCGEEEPSN